MPESPNVLLICTDHWPGRLLGCAGHPIIQTPTLDRLARNGVRFPNSYSECPVCIPARRTLMTGTTCRTHGDRVFNTTLEMPAGTPTIAQTFRKAGYQTYAVGKLHVYPQRDRIGFDDVILCEEGRIQFGTFDDYELFLGDRGYAGKQFAHGMCNNDYLARPWHLPEDTHVTNWLTDQMCRTIARRDPTRPAFWYLSYSHPHPPLAPLRDYLEIYRDVAWERPAYGDWATDPTDWPYALKARCARDLPMNNAQIDDARGAFYALCTHIDHQLRLVLGTLRENGMAENTIILFTSDHGDMLGKHGQWAKRLFYEESANVPFILVGTGEDERLGNNRIDHRLAGWQDIMPTLLDLAGIPVPDSVEGISLISDPPRDYLYGEVGESATATRMVRVGPHKLIYYPVGNHIQLFNLENDPDELFDLSNSSKCAPLRRELEKILIGELYGGDESWVRDGHLVGLPDQKFSLPIDHSLSGQRGTHWPPPGNPPMWAP